MYLLLLRTMMVAATALAAAAGTAVAAGPGRYADLELDLTATPAQVERHGTATYTARVSNLGPADAKETRLEVQVPAEGRLDGYTATQGSCSGETTVVCALGTLPQNGEATVELHVGAEGTGTMTATAVTESQTRDPETSGNAASAAVEVVEPAILASCGTAGMVPSVSQYPPPPEFPPSTLWCYRSFEVGSPVRAELRVVPSPAFVGNLQVSVSSGDGTPLASYRATVVGAAVTPDPPTFDLPSGWSRLYVWGHHFDVTTTSFPDKCNVLFCVGVPDRRFIVRPAAGGFRVEVRRAS